MSPSTTAAGPRADQADQAAEAPAGHRPRARLAFVAALASLTTGFAASASPIPLYPTYRAEDGLTSASL